MFTVNRKFCSIYKSWFLFQLYYHGEKINVNVQVTNNSSKTVKKVKISVRQFADICLFSSAQYKCPVASIEAEWVHQIFIYLLNFLVDRPRRLIFTFTQPFVYINHDRRTGRHNKQCTFYSLCFMYRQVFYLLDSPYQIFTHSNNLPAIVHIYFALAHLHGALYYFDKRKMQSPKYLHQWYFLISIFFTFFCDPVIRFHPAPHFAKSIKSARYYLLTKPREDLLLMASWSTKILILLQVLCKMVEHLPFQIFWLKSF